MKKNKITLNRTNVAFPKHLDLREIGDRRWMLLQDYIFVDPISHRTIVVPKGFITDLYSIPGPIRGLVGTVQNANGPAVVHDWLFKMQLFGPNARRACDMIMINGMECHWAEVKPLNRYRIKCGLYLFSWIPWMINKKRLKKVKEDLGKSELTVEDLYHTYIY